MATSRNFSSTSRETVDSKKSFKSVVLTTLAIVGAKAAIGVIAYGIKIVIKGIADKNKEEQRHKNALDETAFKKKCNIDEAEEIAKIKQKYKQQNQATNSSEHSNSLDCSTTFDCHCCSSDELFNSNNQNDSKWIVNGYMKVGQINFIAGCAGVGKSIFMTQVALAVANGSRPEFLPPESSPSAKLEVYYYRLEDFQDELTGKYGTGKIFQKSVIKWITPNKLPQNNLYGFIEHLKNLSASLTENALVCVDPATKLGDYRHASFIKGVEAAMAIAREHNVELTVVGVVHLDEINDWDKLTSCNIKGGDKLIQQAGSVVAIRRECSNIEEYRFLQCLKEPKGSPKPFNGNVLVCKAVETDPDSGERYLHYQFDSVRRENEARPTKPKTSQDTVAGKKIRSEPTKYPNQKIAPEDKPKIIDMINSGISQKKIAQDYQVNPKTIQRIKAEHK